MIPFDADDALDLLFQSDTRLTAREYIQKIRSRFRVTTAEARRIVQDLVDRQDLSYLDLYGSTYIEKSFFKPVRVSAHFILSPPGHHVSCGPEDRVIYIETGISFGSGQHPTTRLCLNAMDACFFEKNRLPAGIPLKGIDIGTGSGVLAMAMCSSGIDACRAYEIDPVSVSEAKTNIALNLFSDRITLVDAPMTGTEADIAVITANLRFPTLKDLCPLIHDSLCRKGLAVLSGVREWEKDDLIKIYGDRGFDLVWQKDEKQWSAFAWIKKE